MELLARAVRHEMERLGIDQSELSVRSSIPRSTMSRLLRGEVDDWTISKVVAIARALGMSTQRLIELYEWEVDLAQVPEGERRQQLERALVEYPLLQGVVEMMAQLPVKEQQIAESYIQYLYKEHLRSQKESE